MLFKEGLGSNGRLEANGRCSHVSSIGWATGVVVVVGGPHPERQGLVLETIGCWGFWNKDEAERLQRLSNRQPERRRWKQWSMSGKESFLLSVASETLNHIYFYIYIFSNTKVLSVLIIKIQK